MIFFIVLRRKKIKNKNKNKIMCILIKTEKIEMKSLRRDQDSCYV